MEKIKLPAVIRIAKELFFTSVIGLCFLYFAFINSEIALNFWRGKEWVCVVMGLFCVFLFYIRAKSYWDHKLKGTLSKFQLISYMGEGFVVYGTFMTVGLFVIFISIQNSAVSLMNQKMMSFGISVVIMYAMFRKEKKKSQSKDN